MLPAGHRAGDRRHLQRPRRPDAHPHPRRAGGRRALRLRHCHAAPASASPRCRTSSGCCAACVWCGRGGPGGRCSITLDDQHIVQLLRLAITHVQEGGGADDAPVRRLPDPRGVDLQDRGHGLPRGSGDPRAHAEAAGRPRSARRRRDGAAASRQARRRHAARRRASPKRWRAPACGPGSSTSRRFSRRPRRARERGSSSVSGVLLAGGLRRALIPAAARVCLDALRGRGRPRRHSSRPGGPGSRSARGCSTSTS